MLAISYLALGMITMHLGKHAWEEGSKFVGILLLIGGFIQWIIGFFMALGWW